MNLRAKLVLSGCVLLLTATAVTVSAAPNLYRYRDANGTLVIGASVPPEYVKNGYEILNSSGRVIEVVPRAPTPEEIAAREAAEAEARRQRELAQKQAEEDAQLLRLYGGPDGAIQVRDRRLQELEGIISIKRGNLQVVQGQIEEIQAKAAAFERSGRAVPEDMHEDLQRLRGQVQELERDIERSETELQSIAQQYELKIERLRQLKGLTQKNAE